MTVSDTTEHSTSKSFWERVFGQLTRYDLILTVIPLAFAGAAIITMMLAVSSLAALAVSAAVSVIVLLDALFVHPPIRQ